MALVATNQQHAQAIRFLVEEKHYNVSFRHGAPLVREAVEQAMGLRLEELAPGMWTGKKGADKHSDMHVTVRALKTDEGTSVEVRLDHKYNAKAIALWTFLVVIGCVTLLPLIPAIWMSAKLNNEHSRARLVEMHKVWTEIGEAVGAPQRSDYRRRPERAYPPRRIDAPADDAVNEQLAVEEAAVAEVERAQRSEA
jgi:hypothetical protein